MAEEIGASGSLRIGRIIELGAGQEPSCVILIGDIHHTVPLPDATARRGDVYLFDGPALRTVRKIGAAIENGWRHDGDVMRWRQANSRGQIRFEALQQRHIVRQAVRSYFDSGGFIEIDFPLLVEGTTPDATIQSFAVDGRYLVTSCEYQIKRLEIGGFDRVYTLTQNFRRADGEGRTRNQEFTMLEWARVGASLAAIESDVECLIRRAHAALGGSGSILYGGHSVNLTEPFARLTVVQALKRHAGIDLANFELPSLREAVARCGLSSRPDTAEDAPFLFSLLMDHLQPLLGHDRPVFLQDWPAFETSSVGSREATGIAERSELFIAGLEISDGFPTLTDYARQLETFEEQQQRRLKDGAPAVDLDRAYLSALAEGMPEGAGMALGFDRLVMLLTDRSSIGDVLAFAWNEL